MRFPSALRAALIAFVALFGLAGTAQADSGTIRFTVIKGGWIIGGQAGSGTLYFHGRSYPVSIGGLSYGLVFGGSETYFRGTVSHIHSPYDVSGVYGAAGAGGAIIRGAQAVVLANQKGAVLSLTGRQTGLILNVDVSGLAITVK
jgi:hypothetical protein